MAAIRITSFTSRYGRQSRCRPQGGACIRRTAGIVANHAVTISRPSSIFIEHRGCRRAAKRFVLPDKPIVLDLSEVTEFPRQRLLRFLQDLDDARGGRRAGRHCHDAVSTAAGLE